MSTTKNTSHLICIKYTFWCPSRKKDLNVEGKPEDCDAVFEGGPEFSPQEELLFAHNSGFPI